MQKWRDPLVGSALRRDLLVRSVAQDWIIHSASAGTTSAPLRILRRRDLPVRSVELRSGRTEATSASLRERYDNRVSPFSYLTTSENAAVFLSDVIEYGQGLVHMARSHVEMRHCSQTSRRCGVDQNTMLF